MRLPGNIELPFFAYGLFKPDELAYYQIKDFVVQSEKVAIQGSLYLRDGLPLLVESNGSMVQGYRIEFHPEYSLIAYNTIAGFEPEKLYRWSEKIIPDKGVRVNCLVGRSPDKGSMSYDDLKHDPHGSEWHSSEDPVFNKALDVIKDVINELEPTKEFNSAPPDSFDWNRFFRLQMAYLLLWSAIERYCSLAYGPGLKPEEKVGHLGDNIKFGEALRKFLQRKGVVYDSRDLEGYKLNVDNPNSSIRYYRLVRNNLSHRGKAAFNDGEIVRQSLIELLDIFKFIIN